VYFIKIAYAFKRKANDIGSMLNDIESKANTIKTKVRKAHFLTVY